MKIFRDNQIKHFGVFLLIFSLLIFISGILLNMVQENTIQNLFLSHDRAVVTSLLEQGISKEVIAKAITSTAVSPDGIDLLTVIGLTQNTDIKFLPFIAQFQKISISSMIFIGIILSAVLFLGALVFLRKREQLYEQAATVVMRFIAGDFSCHMPQMSEGAIYSLFASIDQLATILQSKNESGQKTKEFLKSTISDISHQLKTPLTALIMYNEIISDETDNIETVTQYSEKTGLALKRMEQLIQSMLKITRLDSGSIVFDKEMCNISDLILLSIRELTTRASSEGKKIIIDENSEDSIICDKQWTGEAVGNIIKNSLDHMNSGGEIHIYWNRTPAMVRIFISDNGTGISPEDIHHIFKRFYRSKKSLDTQGAGLGLSLTKSIIEGQGGVVSVQSSLTEGTVFMISFLTEM